MSNLIFSDKRKGFSPIPLVIIGAFVLVLGFAGWQYGNTIRFSLDPEGRTQEAIDDFIASKALHFRGLVEVDIPKSAPPISLPQGSVRGGKVTIEIEGDEDIFDPERTKFQGLLKLNFKGEGVSFSAEAEAKSTGDLLFVRLLEIPNLGPGMPPGLREQVGQWWKIDLAKIKAAQAKQQAYIMESFRGSQEEEGERVKKLIKELEEASAKALEIKFLTGFEKIGSEKVDGVSTYHVKRFFNKKGLTDALFELAKIIPGWYAETMTAARVTGLQEPPPDLDTFRREVEKALPDFPDIPVHLWIGAKDNKLYQVQPDISGLVKDSNDIKVKITATFTKHNEPITIETPTDAKEFDLTPLLNNFGLSFSLPPVQQAPIEVQPEIEIEQRQRRY